VTSPLAVDLAVVMLVLLLEPVDAAVLSVDVVPFVNGRPADEMPPAATLEILLTALKISLFAAPVAVEATDSMLLRMLLASVSAEVNAVPTTEVIEERSLASVDVAPPTTDVIPPAADVTPPTTDVASLIIESPAFPALTTAPPIPEVTVATTPPTSDATPPIAPPKSAFEVYAKMAMMGRDWKRMLLFCFVG